MSAEWFFKLKEFDSLEKARVAQIKAIKDQEQRVLSILGQRQEKNDILLALEKEIRNIQDQYFESEKKLKSAEEQAQRLREIGADENKISGYLSQASELEDHLFQLIEKTEELQCQVKELQSFLKGSEKSLLEIESDAQREIEQTKMSISQLEFRLQLLKEELPSEFQSALERTLKKNLAFGPFTRIENGQCFFCRFKVSRIDESEIDLQRVLKFCNQCSRIFLPYGQS